MRSSILAASLLLFLAACESKPPEAAPPATPPAGATSSGIEGASRWRVASIDGEPVEVADSLAPTLRMPPATGKAGGFGGCNRWFAEATRSGDMLSFAAIGATKMACGRSAMKLEQRWFAALERVRRATEGAEELVLADSTGAPLATLRHY